MLKGTSTVSSTLPPVANASLIAGVDLTELRAAAMESSFFQLLIFCAVMLFGSYLAGTAPLILPLSEEKLHRVSVFGAGLLVGTALAVIVPEGVQTLIGAFSRSAQAEQATKEQEHSGHSHDAAGHLDGLDRAIGISLVLGFLFMLLVDQCASKKGNFASDLESGSRKGTVSWTTTLGLVVHAAADGIAMGAAATTHQTDVEGTL